MDIKFTEFSRSITKPKTYFNIYFFYFAFGSPTMPLSIDEEDLRWNLRCNVGVFYSGEYFHGVWN